MKLACAELGGYALEYATARAEGFHPRNIHFNFKPINQARRGGIWIGDENHMRAWQPTSAPAQWGMLLRRESETVTKRDGVWTVEMRDRTGFVVNGVHRELGVAVCRARVIAKFGFEVDIPDEIAIAGCQPVAGNQARHLNA